MTDSTRVLLPSRAALRWLKLEVGQRARLKFGLEVFPPQVSSSISGGVRIEMPVNCG